MKRLYHGSCHCGTVRYEAALDLADRTYRCNCRFCWKLRMWKVFALRDDFTLVAGAENLADYRGPDSNWPEGNIHHWFCRTCGTHAFSKGYLEMEPFRGWFHAVNVATLDDVSDEALAAAPITYENGRANDWDHPPAVTRHL
jgi:hypothetical protein